jgi:ureidoglycolate hydrolase
MSSERIEVVAYAGYRDEESPRSFVCRGKQIDVAYIMKMWREEGTDRERKRFFRVRDSGGRTYTLYYDEHSRDWHLTGRAE